MAIVRITDTITREVLHNVDRLFAPRLGKAQEFTCPYTSTELYDMLFGEWKEHMLALPTPIISRYTKFLINKVKDVQLGYMVALPMEMPIPTQVPLNDRFRVYSMFDKSYDLFGPKWDELYALAKARMDRIEQVLDETKQFKDEVDKVLKQFSTLAPALKAWPPLWDLLSEGVKNKHKQVVTRTKTKVDLSSVDINKLTATVVMTKLTR